jgi:ubiquinone/menaquinone biosynthesis C-methylase UbiE
MFELTELKEITSKLDSIEIIQNEMETILEPYRVRTIPRDSTEGKLMVRQRKKGILYSSLLFYKNRILEFQQLKKKKNVKASYDNSYRDFDFTNYGYPAARKPGRYFYKEDIFELHPSGLKLFSTLMIENIISKLQVSSVCECGTGTGRHLIFLASRNKNMNFAGFDCSNYAIKIAKNALKQPHLNMHILGDPEPLARNDLNEISNRVRFICCSADKIEFQDKSIDIMFTSQALEQMWDIRKDVLSEIHRVTKSYVIFYEPFLDGNDFYGQLFLRCGNYFRYRQVDIEQYGFKIIKSFNIFPTKPTFNCSMVVAKVL